MTDTPKYNIIISDRAKQMLGLNLSYYARMDKDAAHRKKNQIMAAIRSLSEFPGRCPFLSGSHLPPNKYHKLYVEKWHLILYQIKDNTVYVDLIIDCRSRDYTWLLE